MISGNSVDGAVLNMDAFVVDVPCGYYYSLVYRAKNAGLESAVYMVDFFEWVKAGIAYNTRANELENRKVSNFVKLYSTLAQIKSRADLSYIALYIRYFYEDLLDIYGQYIASVQTIMRERGRRKSKIRPVDMYILPSFKSCSGLRQVFRSQEIKDVKIVKKLTVIASEEFNKYFPAMQALYNASLMEGVLLYDRRFQ